MTDIELFLIKLRVFWNPIFSRFIFVSSSRFIFLVVFELLLSLHIRFSVFWCINCPIQTELLTSEGKLNLIRFLAISFSNEFFSVRYSKDSNVLNQLFISEFSSYFQQKLTSYNDERT